MLAVNRAELHTIFFTSLVAAFLGALTEIK